ncbi:MAG: hypothetical protein P8L68_17445 [Paracoccaceae bacterium]|nr:hypothetical protein [Paracoccaceae bacterium]MDG2260267.1 hypothetical protein [Paracoccaceae bacterium]
MPDFFAASAGIYSDAHDIAVQDCVLDVRIRSTGDIRVIAERCGAASPEQPFLQNAAFLKGE